MSAGDARRRVWVVDDSPTDAERARRSLGDDVECVLFHDGAAVLEALATGVAPDLIVLDWVMPGVTGIEVCRFLRADRGNAAVSVLLLTAQNAVDQVVEGLAAGANDFVSKPYAPEELRARSMALLRTRVLLERAERAETTVRQLLENTPDALLVAGRSGRVEYANAAAGEMFERPANSLVGLALTELLPGKPDLDSEMTLGSRLWAPTLRDMEGPEGRTSISFRDVTERRAAEEKRLDFYSMTAHDLRSPLFAILLRTEVILKGKRGVLSAELASDVQKIHRGIRTLVGTVSDFLDLARMENKATKVQRETVDLRGLASTAIDDFAPLAEASNVTLSAPGLPDVDAAVGGDPHRLVQVFNNLIANAIKFTSAGGEVRVSVETRGDRWRISVSDTGRGIAPDLLPHIFDRYVRAIDADHEVAGTGLGLMIVRQIVEQHGGQIGVESQIGAGSTFWFELPALAAEARAQT